MPHSSGGGSSGGGTHSGSSSGSSSSNTTRQYSSRPFAGAICYTYYDRHYNPRLIYASKGPNLTTKSFIGQYVAALLVLLFAIFLFIYPSYHHPHKLKIDYPSEIVIHDYNNVLTADESLSLEETFNDFLDITGISPAFLSIDFNTINGYSDLEEYAYDYYIANFSDEKHWLIVYSSDEGTIKGNWTFEGMQGNDTDPILYTHVTSNFNETFYKYLDKEDESVASALIKAFDQITPHIMDQTFYVEPVTIIIFVVGLAFTAYLSFSATKTLLNYYHMKEAVVVPGEPILKTCPSCGCLYYSESMDKCYRCGKDFIEKEQK